MLYLSHGKESLWIWRYEVMDILADNIGITLGNRRILENISMHVENKEFVGIIGPNGSGKSTFLKSIYRVLKPDAGMISLNSIPLTKMSIRNSALLMGVVSQHNYYNFDFTVEEVVLMGRSPHKHAMERDNSLDYDIVRESLRTVGMESFSERSFSTLSGGEQQRVILARALAQQTSCLILDEPTNHLDIKYQLQLMSIVKELHLTVISAIHDLNIASMFCDKLYVMRNGRIAACGTPREVLTKNNIKDIYEIDAEIIEDSKGQMHILYSY